MKFLIDKQTLSADQQLFLANFELSVKQYIELVLRDYPTLGVTPNWSVVERKDKFFIIESNMPRWRRRKRSLEDERFGILRTVSVRAGGPRG